MTRPIGESLMLRRTLDNRIGDIDDSQRENIFQTRCLIHGNICIMIVDGGSCTNVASERLVTKLNLVTKPHPKPYKLQWLSEDGVVLVKNQVEVELSIGKYHDKVLCDVAPMETSHLLLGRPWQFDKRTNHNGFSNKITFMHHGKKVVLKPLSPSEAREDQKRLREKIAQEKREMQKVRETLERQKSESLKRKQDDIAKEKRGKLMILAKQPLNLSNCGNQIFSANHFVNLKLFSSVKFFLQDFKDETTKETSTSQLQFLRRRNVDIIPSAPLFTEPTFGSQVLVSNEDKANECVVENTNANQKLCVDDLSVCKIKILHDLLGRKLVKNNFEFSYSNSQTNAHDEFCDSNTRSQQVLKVSQRKEERMKKFIQGKFLFDPGGEHGVLANCSNTYSFLFVVYQGPLDLRTNLFQEGGSDADKTKDKGHKACKGLGIEDMIKGNAKELLEGQGRPKLWAKTRAILNQVLIAIVKVRPKMIEA